MSAIVDQLQDIGIIPMIAIEDADKAVALGRAFMDAGLACAEITFRTPDATKAMARMASAFPEMVVGAGTVLTVDQAKQAKDAGVKFVVTPGFDSAVVAWCLANDLPIMPGVMTPTDINQAIGMGLELLKFFPAEAAGGTKALKAIGGPYGGVKFLPTGGINLDNLADYLALPMVIACGGSFLAKRQMIANNEFDKIREIAISAVDIVHSVRASHPQDGESA